MSEYADTVNALLLYTCAQCQQLRSNAAATMSMSDIAEGFIKNTEKTFGAPHPTREKVRSARRIVVKVAPFLAPSNCGCTCHPVMHVPRDLCMPLCHTTETTQKLEHRQDSTANVS